MDASLLWSGDLSLTAAGDLALATGPTLVQQRILRRLLTNQLDYSWQPTYGGGLGSYVGQPGRQRAAEAAIRAQLYMEAAVAHQPEPVISTSTSSDGSLLISIVYADASLSTPQTLSFALDS